MIRSWSWLERAAALTAVLCLILMAVRVGSAVSLTTPLHVVTSGTEHGPLFTIWKAMSGLSVTTDRHNFPYDSTVYNWLFYRAYGFISGLFLSAFGLADEWLPTAARLLTLLALPLTILAARRAFGLVDATESRESTSLVWSMAILLAAGPLVGFWAVTARPDTWAMLLEICAVTLFLRLDSKSRSLAVLGFALLALAAWSMKQTNIFSLAGMGLFLLLRLRLRDLALLVGISFAGWAVTVWINGPEFAQNLFFVGIPFNFQIWHPVFVLKSAATKMIPILALLASGVGLGLKLPAIRARILRDDPLMLALCGAVASFALAYATSVQEGSAENYYFVPSFFAALVGFRLRALSGSARRPVWVDGIHLVGWAAMAGAIGLILSGHAGTLSVRGQNEVFVAQRQCLKDLTPPYFVKDDYLSLPWMSHPNPPIPLSYSYYDERRVGNTFQQGGIGGLIEQGYFTTLVFVAPKPPETMDGALLGNYVLRPSRCADMVFMDRLEGGK